MSAIHLKNQNQKLMCLLFGHKLTVKRNITDHIKEYECKTCHLELTNDYHGEKTYLTSKLRDVNETLFNLHVKRHQHFI
jgi:transposase-like protein